MFKRTGLLLFFIFSFVLSNAQTEWPAITHTTKPWTRWWWEGSAVTPQGLRYNLEKYQQAGLGGVEITPIYGIYGFENQFVNFLSPEWMKLLEHTLSEAKRLDMGVDLANGTGWPFGGPWVTDADASKTLFNKIWTLKKGETVPDIYYTKEAFVRTANNKPVQVGDLVQPVATNKNLQALALDQVQYPGRLRPLYIGAYDPTYKRVIDITNKPDSTGLLNWKAPADGWTIHALYEGLHGKMVERAAPGGEGYAIDHFSSKAAKNYFKRFDSAFKGYDISYLRAFFNDSYEVDDARGQSNWTGNLLAEFKKRKGYDLRTALPDLFGKRDSAKTRRVLYDYRSVIDELLLEQFTMEWKKWGGSKGKMLRNQSHGSPANTLDLYGVVDIPETEGTDILRFKFATSSANVMGKKLVSAEACTWLNEHFLSSLGDVKKAVDLYFLGGVNHIVYHGTAYSPEEAPWPGWLFYAAVHFQPTNPQWKDFHALNQYITRVQSFLQSGKPDNDVLLYYPIADRYSEQGPVLLQHFDGMERNFENTNFEHVSKWMLEKGYSFDFFSDRQLMNVKSVGGSLNSGGNNYRTILLPANKLIPEKSFRQLLALAEKGHTIIVYKKMPGDIPGSDLPGKSRVAFQQLLKKLKFSGTGNLQTAIVGKGKIIVSEDLEALMQAGSARKEQLAEKGLSVLRRKNENGNFYFVNNRGAENFSGSVALDEAVMSVILFDAMTGEHGLARIHKNSEGKTEVFLQLRPFESIIIQSYKKEQDDQLFRYPQPVSFPVTIKGTWTITFTDGGPVIPSVKTVDKLGSWTELDGDDVKNYSGTANYFIDFEKPAGHTGDWMLDLGKVNETAEVKLNGTTIATLVGPVFQCVIPAKALKQTNKLEIVVSSLMANRIAYMDRNNLPWKIFYNTNMPARRRENVKNGLFDASAWKPTPSGLSGPVTITPLQQFK
jgi:hypothetical protein